MFFIFQVYLTRSLRFSTFQKKFIPTFFTRWQISHYAMRFGGSHSHGAWSNCTLRVCLYLFRESPGSSPMTIKPPRSPCRQPICCASRSCYAGCFTALFEFGLCGPFHGLLQPTKVKLTLVASDNSYGIRVCCAWPVTSRTIFKHK